MEKFEHTIEMSKKESATEPEHVYHALNRGKEESILAEFTPEQQAEIKEKQRVLSSLAYFIGKDFKIPVELNSPGAGWHWDFENNVIRIDSKDLLEKPMDYLRFVISHEGGHRRISRTDFIPLEEWRQPGFSFMMNAIEDPRDNNFVAEAYPKFREQMSLAYQEDLDFEAKAKQKADQKLGRQPRFMQAGFEYIKQWFKEAEGKEFQLSEDLPEDVRTAVAATLESARDSWLRYPSRVEADNGGRIGRKKADGEAVIREYAKLSYEINRDEVWPEFKKLVEADMEDQKAQELMKDLQRGEEGEPKEGEGQSSSEEKPSNGGNLPQNLKDKLTPEEQKTLEEAIKKAIKEAEKEQQEAQAQPQPQGQETEGAEGKPQPVAEGKPAGKPVDLGSLPQELKQKIKEYIESLPEDQQKEIAEKAQAALKEFEDALNEELQGKLSDDPEKKAEREKKLEERDEIEQSGTSAGERVISKGPVKERPTKILGQRVFSEKLAEMEKGENEYEKYRKEVMPLIDKLEAELRQIFVDRKVTAWKGGFKGGKRIDIKRRIQEKAKDVPVMESHAWQRRERPDEKEYAVTILNDVSGSMAWDGKSTSDLKAKIVLAEVLNKIGVNVEIIGFHDELIEYQNFGQDISKEVRERIGEMPQVVRSKRCDQCKMDHNATDIGWATKAAAERLAKQKAKQKILITISDYQLEESPKHPARDYALDKIRESLEETDLNLIDIDLGHGGFRIEALPETLAELIKKAIANEGKP
ncbi:MAG: hypothetical protein HY505_02775 [Candidatus Yanofskybacteria bacterium]|nr:hypothetical protein [Candidatus Yanofskybacteria bacterium]